MHSDVTHSGLISRLFFKLLVILIVSLDNKFSAQVVTEKGTVEAKRILVFILPYTACIDVIVFIVYS